MSWLLDMDSMFLDIGNCWVDADNWLADNDYRFLDAINWLADDDNWLVDCGGWKINWLEY